MNSHFNQKKNKTGGGGKQGGRERIRSGEGQEDDGEGVAGREENEEKSTGGEAGRMVERNSSIHRSQMF